jgi:hypothetical protein
MLICFFDIKGIIHSECVPSKYLTRQCAFKFWNVYGVHSLKKTNLCLDKLNFHHDNALSHTALSVRLYLSKQIPVLWDPLYLSDLVLHDVCVPKTKILERVSFYIT